MEVFSAIIRRQCAQPDFKFYWRCKSTGLSHLFFADDVLMFSEADSASISHLRDGIQLFSSWSGLLPNPNKSEIFLSGTTSAQQEELQNIVGYRIGSFPLRYLGLPVVTSRLKKSDCVTLVNAITARARSWTHRFLSHSGRLLLVRSVLYAIHVYWANAFHLPSGVLQDIEKTLRQFLWRGPDLGPGGAKVSWADICLPVVEGGLGIRRLKDWNKAAMLKHIWLLFTDSESLWCKWVHSIFLKHSSFWIVRKPTICSWTWKKVLDLRPEAAPFFKWKVGNGRRISFWHDSWHPRGPLYHHFSTRDIKHHGLPRDALLSDFFSFQARHSRVTTTLLLWGDPTPVPTDEEDSLIWTQSSSTVFTTTSAWNSIRLVKPKVPWSSFIWNNTIPPRFQFHLWLIMKRRLPTQVLLLSYGRIQQASCAFCSMRPDSIDHLFFACAHSSSLLNYWAAKCNLVWFNGTWDSHIERASSCLMGDSFSKKVSRFSFAATCYIIWKERNNILFRAKSFCIASLKNRLHKAVKDFTSQYRRVPDTPANRRLQRCWDLSPTIFS